MSGTQWPEENGGSVHSSTAIRGRGRPATAPASRSNLRRSVMTNAAARSSVRGGPPDGLDGRDDLLERHRVEREHLGPAPQMLQRLVDFV